MLIVAFTMSFPCYAEIFYKEDFEDGGANWEFRGRVEVSDAKAHSGNNSVLVAEGTAGGDSANLLIEMPDGDVSVPTVPVGTPIVGSEENCPAV